MALRIRSDGRVLCAAMHGAEPGDTYIDDQLAYSLSAEHRVLGTEPMHLPDGGGHASHGQWWWMGNVPDGIQIAPSYLIPLPNPVCETCSGTQKVFARNPHAPRFVDGTHLDPCPDCALIPPSNMETEK